MHFTFFLISFLCGCYAAKVLVVFWQNKNISQNKLISMSYQKIWSSIAMPACFWEKPFLFLMSISFYYVSTLVLHYLNMHLWAAYLKHFITAPMWCNQANWVRTCRNHFGDTAKHKEKFLLFSIVLHNFQLLLSLKLIKQFSWSCQLYCTTHFDFCLSICGTIKQEERYDIFLNLWFRKSIKHLCCWCYKTKGKENLCCRKKCFTWM